MSRFDRGGPRAALLLALSLLCGLVAAAGNGWYVERDFHCFWAAGAVVAAGGDPYDAKQYQAAVAEGRRERVDAVASCGPRLPYPPWTALVFGGLGALPHSVAATLWISVLVAATVLGIGWSWQLAGPGRIAWPLVAALVVFTEPFLLALREGQFAGLSLAMTAGAAVALRSRRGVRAGIAIAGMALKPQTALLSGLVLIALAVRDRQWRAIAAAGLVLLAASAVCVALRPSWFVAWAVAPAELRGMAIARNTTWDLAASLGAWTLGLGIIAVLLLAVFALVRSRPLADADVVALGVALSLVVAPYAWTHDFVVLAIPWSVTLAHANELRPARRRVLTVATLAVAVPLLWTLFARGDEPPVAVIPMLTTLLLALSIRWATRSATIRKTPEVT